MKYLLINYFLIRNENGLSQFMEIGRCKEGKQFLFENHQLFSNRISFKN